MITTTAERLCASKHSAFSYNSEKSQLSEIRQPKAFAKTNLATYGSSLYNYKGGLTMTVKGKKEERIDARLTAEAKQQIDQAAALQGRSTSDFMVQAALKEASHVIEQQRIIRLTVEESVALAELMSSEPKVNEASVAAMRLHNQIIGS